MLNEKQVICELFAPYRWLEGISRFCGILVVLLLANAGVGYSQWDMLHPSILNYSSQNSKVVRANKCEFVNKESGFILTNKGLGVTTDGGETWSLDTAIPGYSTKMFFTLDLPRFFRQVISPSRGLLIG